MQTPTAHVKRVRSAGSARASRGNYTRLRPEQRQEYLDWIFGEKKSVGYFAVKFGCSKQHLYWVAHLEKRKRRGK